MAKLSPCEIIPVDIVPWQTCPPPPHCICASRLCIVPVAAHVLVPVPIFTASPMHGPSASGGWKTAGGTLKEYLCMSRGSCACTCACTGVCASACTHVMHRRSVPLHCTCALCLCLFLCLRRWPCCACACTFTCMCRDRRGQSQSSNGAPAEAKGSQFVVSFTSTSYGKLLSGILCIDTQEMQWRYEVHGSLPKYFTPEGTTKLDRQLAPVTQERLKEAREARAKRNFMKENQAFVEQVRR